MTDIRMGFPVYIYQHVPKCGGTSFRTACRSFFTEVHEVPPKKDDPEAWEAFRRNKVDFATLGPDTIITGHLIHDGVRPRERYAQEIAGADVKILTVLREPLSRMVSGYAYATQLGKNLPVTLDQRLRKAKNPMSRYLGFDGTDAGTFLKSFFLVGLTEHLQATVDLLAKSIGKESVEVPRVNVSKDRAKLEVSPETAAVFRANNARDYELYETAVRIFRERCRGELGREV